MDIEKRKLAINRAWSFDEAKNVLNALRQLERTGEWVAPPCVRELAKALNTDVGGVIPTAYVKIAYTFAEALGV